MVKWHFRKQVYNNIISHGLSSSCEHLRKYITEIFLLLAMAIAKSMKCCRVSLPLI